MLVVINTLCDGSFAISQKAIEHIQKKIKNKSDKKLITCYSFDKDRGCNLLVDAVKVLKDQANGKNCILKIVEIPDDIEWVVCGCSGKEWIAEKHRTWR